MKKNETANKPIVDATPKLELNKLPRAKRHALLRDASARLSGCHREQIFPLYGMRFNLRTLDYLGDLWTAQFVPEIPFGKEDEAFLSVREVYFAGKATRAPFVAAAITAIGFSEDEHDETKPLIPLKELFAVPDEMSEGMKELLEKDEAYRADWLRGEMLIWLGEQADSQPKLIETLYDRYLILDIQRREALEALGPLPKTTPIGGSLDTSSPRPEDSSQSLPSAS